MNHPRGTFALASASATSLQTLLPIIRIELLMLSGFAAGAVKAMTDVDPMPEFRGRYSTARGSARALKRIGRGDLAATLDAKFEAVPASLAQRGDIVMSSGLLGICWGAVLFAVGREGDREGLVRIDRRQWVDPRAWRVKYGG